MKSARYCMYIQTDPIEILVCLKPSSGLTSVSASPWCPAVWLRMMQTEVMMSARDSESHITTGTVLLREPGPELCTNLSIVTTNTWAPEIKDIEMNEDQISATRSLTILMRIAAKEHMMMRIVSMRTEIEAIVSQFSTSLGDVTGMPGWSQLPAATLSFSSTHRVRVLTPCTRLNEYLS